MRKKVAVKKGIERKIKKKEEKKRKRKKLLDELEGK